MNLRKISNEMLSKVAAGNPRRADFKKALEKAGFYYDRSEHSWQGEYEIWLDPHGLEIGWIGDEWEMFEKGHYRIGGGTTEDIERFKKMVKEGHGTEI